MSIGVAADGGSDGRERRVAGETLSVVVPVYNESRRFGMYATKFCEFISSYPSGSELIFVDDGSTDDTASLADCLVREHPQITIILICRPHLGKGAAVRTGLEAATGDLAGFCDIDLATPLEEFSRLVDAARSPFVLAIGSRGTASSRISARQQWYREALGKAYNRAVQYLLLPGIVDTQCGAKVASSVVWKKVNDLCQEDGFAWDVEAIAIARLLGIAVDQIGIEWRHRDGSQVHVLRDGVAMLWALRRIRERVIARRGDRSRGVEGGGTFGAENAVLLAEFDTNHWWYKSKSTYVAQLIRERAHGEGWLVDVGGGSGGVTAKLGWRSDRTLVVEGNFELVRTSKDRYELPGAVGDAEFVPLADGCADVVTLLDVIEHLNDVSPTLAEARRMLSRHGKLIVSVPAHPRLWSAADEVLGHARRYTRATLSAELEAAGLEVEWITHVFSWLAVPVWLKRRMSPASDPQLGTDVASPLIDRVSKVLTRIEWAAVSRFSLPIGTSVMCVCSRPPTAGSDALPRPGSVPEATTSELFELQKTLYTSSNPTRRWLHRSRLAWITDALERSIPGPEAKVIEIGPGSGIYLERLVDQTAEVVGADIEDAYLAGIRPLALQHANLRLVRDDITASALPEGEFDLVLCTEVIEHIADSPAALAGMHRLLRPGGTLILSTPQRFSPLEVCSKVAFLPGVIGVVRRIYGEAILKTGHINLMTNSTLRSQVTRAGFEIHEEHFSGVYLPLVSELFGARALEFEEMLEPKLRAGRWRWLLWEQYLVATAQ